MSHRAFNDLANPGFSLAAGEVEVKEVKEGSCYAVFNAQLGYDITQKTGLTLAVNNFTDRHYYERIRGLNSYNIYGEPRSVSLNLRAGF
ncbi:TonB-dependent receptor [Methylophaga muralis]|uniref:Fe(3+)-pyochelin receptor n=1 Tax=Methylophaga muralis TaxID=291169 RepID=A0A1E3GVS3_9GAMM|nr:TonB-dependent receptor [Methylophaga muralis]ODN68137.1 Fe(3+)-pyochelin receptor precursor [Methylophaga muralis]